MDDKQCILIPVILSGGAGTRLWPLSRKNYPKQMLELIGDSSLFQNTLRRVQLCDNVNDTIVICAEELRFAIANQIEQLALKKKPTIILEPIGRGTAAATALAALQAINQYPELEPILWVLPIDHHIGNQAAFVKALQLGLTFAAEKFVTFGVKPDRAETGYGYIKTLKENKANIALPIEQFVEKPNLVTAKQYIASNHYYWNSGMFMFSARIFLKELAAHEPEVLSACQLSYQHIRQRHGYLWLPEQVFASCRAISIDNAVMEKTKQGVMVPLNCQWGDIGSWLALWELSEADKDNNVTKGDVVTTNVTDSYIQAESRLLCAVGVSDTIIVETADVVLVANKNCSQEIKDMVDQLVKRKRPEATTHRKIYRPWGWYEVLNESAEFKVKKIHIKPGQSLSLQMHLHRSEHWVVVNGMAEILCDNKMFVLNKNESISIPKMKKHRLKNISSKSLEIIETQVGAYLGEDDIIRFEDQYGRIPVKP